jgi:hypothetical protein
VANPYTTQAAITAKWGAKLLAELTAFGPAGAPLDAARLEEARLASEAAIEEAAVAGGYAVPLEPLGPAGVMWLEELATDAVIKWLVEHKPTRNVDEKGRKLDSPYAHILVRVENQLKLLRIGRKKIDGLMRVNTRRPPHGVARLKASGPAAGGADSDTRVARVGFDGSITYV